jgi:hypothetical protein
MKDDVTMTSINYRFFRRNVVGAVWELWGNS